MVKIVGVIESERGKHQKLTTKIKQLEAELSIRATVKEELELRKENQRLEWKIDLYESYIKSYFGKKTVEKLRQKALKGE